MVRPRTARLIRLCLCIAIFIPAVRTRGQNYHGIEGSPYAGSIGVANNPASILSTPYPWDVTILSAQLKMSTNAVTFHNWSLLSHGDSILYSWDGGNKKRFVAADFNLHLLNARFALGRKQAIAFGVNIRGYMMARSGTFNYQDTLKNMNEFFDINPNTIYNAKGVTNSWLELSGTYSRTIWDNTSSRLNAGVTARLMRGISGAVVQLNNASVTRTAVGDQTLYYLRAGSAMYGYSQNYDRWKNGNSTMQNIKDFVGGTLPGASFDIGAEYLIKSQAPKVYSYDENDDDYYDYEWKIGVSLLDLGGVLYKYGSESRTASSPRTDVSDAELNAKFDTVGSLAEFNDSLATIVNNISGGIPGRFMVYTPARIVVNVDRPLVDNFSINANLSLNLPVPDGKKSFAVRDMNLLTVTPRWETRRFGAYMPVMLNRYGKCWVGGAFKAGPLLFGVHNFMTVLSKNKMQNGGLYFALVLRPGKGITHERTGRQFDCPKY